MRVVLNDGSVRTYTEATDVTENNDGTLLFVVDKNGVVLDMHSLIEVRSWEKIS